MHAACLWSTPVPQTRAPDTQQNKLQTGATFNTHGISATAAYQRPDNRQSTRGRWGINHPSLSSKIQYKAVKHAPISHHDNTLHVGPANLPAALAFEVQYSHESQQYVLREPMARLHHTKPRAQRIMHGLTTWLTTCRYPRSDTSDTPGPAMGHKGPNNPFMLFRTSSRPQQHASYQHEFTAQTTGHLAFKINTKDTCKRTGHAKLLRRKQCLAQPLALGTSGDKWNVGSARLPNGATKPCTKMPL